MKFETRNPELRTPGGIVATLSKAWAVLSITIASRFAYLGEIVVRSTFLVLILFIFTQLWRSTSQGRSLISLTGFDVAQLIWYLAFTEAIVTSVSQPEVDQEVRSGDVAYRIARPLAYPLYHLSAMLGERLLRFAINLLVGSLVALLVVGPIRFGPLAVVAAIVTAIGGFVIDRMVVLTIALLAFWVENTSGIQLLYSRCVMLLGGLLIPLDAYPEWLQRISRALPFQYLVYQPARLFVQADASGVNALLLIQLLIGAIVLVPLLLIYRAGLRRVSAQGG